MRHVSSTALLSLALAGPSAARAAAAHVPPTDSVVADRRIDPRLMPLARRVDATAPQQRPAALTFPHPNARQSVGLMVGGGAAIVVGAVVGGNVGGALAMGGTVAGFYGLYHYMTRDDSIPSVPPRGGR